MTVVASDITAHFSKVLKFADDTKVFRKVTNVTEKQSLQDDVDKLVKVVLGRTTQEKDLGVKFSVDMKVSEQCRIAASRGNQVLGLIRRTITYKEKQLIVPLHKAIVRPHLEYCIQAWRPYRKKDIDKLERIKRRATKIIQELRDLSYESCLLHMWFDKTRDQEKKRRPNRSV